MSEMHYHFKMTVPGNELRRSALCFHPELPGSAGIENSDPAYDPRVRRRPAEYLAELEERDGALGGVVIVETRRNLIQNWRTPAWVLNGGICEARREQSGLSRRPYYGISSLKNGKLRGDVYGPSQEFASDVVSWGAGLPVVWNGEPLTFEEMLPEISDFSWAWRLDRARYLRLQEAFVKHLHAQAEEARDAMLEEARGPIVGDEPLIRDTAYLHHVTGVLSDGGLFIGVVNARLEDVGLMAREAGAVSAVIVDNGGSIQISQRRPGGTLRPLIESYYHREGAVAVAIYELEGGAGHRHEGVPARSRVAGSGRSAVRVHFDTDRGSVMREWGALGLDDADEAAVRIANFAVVHGAHRLNLEAPGWFVRHVNSRFAERFRVTPEAEDPTKLRGQWLDLYLGDLNGTPFSIEQGGPFSPRAVVAPLRLRSEPSGYSLGLDIGGTAIQAVLLDGDRLVAESQVPSLVDAPRYTSVVLAEQIRKCAEGVLVRAGVRVSDLTSVGISWAGAVDGSGRAATSKAILNMRDVLQPPAAVDARLLAEVRQIARFVKAALALPAVISVSVFNDGEAEVLYEAVKANMREAVLFKLGATVAGGYIDAEGGTGYLTEVGRCVIERGEAARRHRYSKIQGFASLYIGSLALAQNCGERGITNVRGGAVSRDDPGRELGALLSAGGNTDAVHEVLAGMGKSLAALIEECAQHLPPIRHILLRGGLVGGHEVGRLIRESAKRALSPDLAGAIIDDAPDQHTGASAAAWLAARLV